MSKGTNTMRLNTQELEFLDNLLHDFDVRTDEPDSPFVAEAVAKLKAKVEVCKKGIK